MPGAVVSPCRGCGGIWRFRGAPRAGLACAPSGRASLMASSAGRAGRWPQAPAGLGGGLKRRPGWEVASSAGRAGNGSAGLGKGRLGWGMAGWVGEWPVRGWADSVRGVLPGYPSSAGGYFRRGGRGGRVCARPLCPLRRRSAVCLWVCAPPGDARAPLMCPGPRPYGTICRHRAAVDGPLKRARSRRVPRVPYGTGTSVDDGEGGHGPWRGERPVTRRTTPAGPA